MIKLLNKIESGAFGDVWEAKDSLDRSVAVKIIRSSGIGVSDALAHAKALARAEHPNVVEVHSIDKVIDPDSGDSVECVVMELINGETLGTRLHGEDFTIDEVKSIGSGIIDGLEHIHAQGLTHGDLHNENIMLDGARVKIIDILYLDTLSILTTQSKDQKIQRDLVSLRLNLHDLLFKSALDPGEITEFNNLLLSSSDIQAIRQAFTKVTDVNETNKIQRLLDHAYRRATDDNFVRGIDYANALAGETSRDVIFLLLKKVIENYSFESKHKDYVRILWTKLNANEIDDLIEILNVRIEEDTPDGKWWPNLKLVAMLPNKVWHRLSPAVTIKLENMITNSMLSGRYDIHSIVNNSGLLGTYATIFWRRFSNRARVIDNIESMLKQGWYTQNYIGKHFLQFIPRIVDTPEDRERLIIAIAGAVRDDARMVVNRLSELPEDWIKDIKEIQSG